MSAGEPELSFEDAVSRLEAIVTELEAGGLPLDECLRRFEQAVALSRHCAARLEAAEKQIEVLTAGGGLRPAADEDAPATGESREGDGEAWH